MVVNLRKTGELICKLRKEKSMTQKQIADKLGIEPKTVSCLDVKKCNAEHTPKISEIENDYYIEFNHKMTKKHYIHLLHM